MLGYSLACGLRLNVLAEISGWKSRRLPNQPSSRLDEHFLDVLCTGKGFVIKIIQMFSSWCPARSRADFANAKS